MILRLRFDTILENIQITNPSLCHYKDDKYMYSGKLNMHYSKFIYNDINTYQNYTEEKFIDCLHNNCIVNSGKCYGMSHSSVIFTNYDKKVKLLLGMDVRLLKFNDLTN